MHAQTRREIPLCDRYGVVEGRVGGGLDKEWRDFDQIADAMKRAAVAAEDQKILNHYGFDFDAMGKAINKNANSKKLVGGSTISQQTAKNVFLWPGRSYIRKAFEAYFTALIEVFWSKKSTFVCGVMR